MCGFLPAVAGQLLVSRQWHQMSRRALIVLRSHSRQTKMASVMLQNEHQISCISSNSIYMLETPAHICFMYRTLRDAPLI